MKYSCESIRKQLEKCSFERDLRQCITLHSTGSTIPTTNDYVTEMMREQKRKQQTNRPKLPVKPARHPKGKAEEEHITAGLPQESSESKATQDSTTKHNTIPSRSTTPVQDPDRHDQNNETKQASERIRSQVSQHAGSTATRGQIRRKPLNKALMEQVTNEMAMARQQTEEKQPTSPLSTEGDRSDKSKKPVETTEPVKDYVHPNAVVSEEARARRQPSEYKPDTGSIPIRKAKSVSSSTTPNHILKEIATEQPSQEFMSAHPIIPPKSPRPSAQQIFTDEAQPHPYNPNMPSNMPPYTTNPYDTLQQQHPLRSPLMQPMASPMMQAHRSPLMQPMASPMMQAHRSPMMQPMASPMMGPQQHAAMHYGTQPRGTLPPPITIPNSNYGPSPQASPAIPYANLNCVSPGGVLPPPVVNSPYMAPSLPRPHQFTDGRSIQFWARAKYDYVANDADELSFKAHQLIGVLEADMTQQSWWYGALWDEYRQVWSVAGSVPSNFMDTS
ncbi:hypothetical protein A0J61_09965 [Choanephora cucurbitarum]|uniref:SH3 domain-containing protein n=1 Tax=Choanephora cucurbitarum TaxID=101091 RepID=A0A1C7MYS3_9FUNG|nr:hypothetical protein A0J61_09965 [Choanephora cucurbitarum]